MVKTIRGVPLLGHTRHATRHHPKRLGGRAGITTEGGEAAEAAGPGAAPVQVAEGLQAHGTCGHRAHTSGRPLGEESMRVATK